MRYAEHAVARTEAPGSLRQLWRQRYRWSYGTMQAAWKHRHALVERGHAGRFGRVGLPLLAVFQILTPLLAPLIDLLTVYGLVFGNAALTLLAWCGVLAVQGCAPRTRSVSTGSRYGRCGRCRCSRSCTGR